MGEVLKLVKAETADRVCKDCETAKPLVEFHLQASGRPSWRCKPCHVISERKRQKALWASNPEYRERHNAAGKAYRRGEVKPKRIVDKTGPRECKVCGVTKPAEEFPLRSGGNRLRSCNPCYKAFENDKAKQKYRDDIAVRAAHIAAAKRSYEKQKNDPIFKQKRNSIIQNRDYHFEYKYGVTFQQLEAVLQKQLGLCANRGCGEKLTFDAPRASKNRAVVDHDHATGAVREILCNHCNTLLGHVEKYENRVLGLIEYAQKHKTKETPTQ